MKKTLISIGIGAGLMYLFDPELGEVRRSLLADKFQGILPQTQEALASKVEAVSVKASELTEIADSAAAEKIDSIASDSIGAVDAVEEKVA